MLIIRCSFTESFLFLKKKTGRYLVHGPAQIRKKCDILILVSEEYQVANVDTGEVSISRDGRFLREVVITQENCRAIVEPNKISVKKEDSFGDW